MSPAIEYTPSCASPGNWDGSSEANPHTDVNTPRRIVRQRGVLCAECPLVESALCGAWMNRYTE